MSNGSEKLDKDELEKEFRKIARTERRLYTDNVSDFIGKDFEGVADLDVTNTPNEENHVFIGTPFLSNGLQFVLYKPSEADTKPTRKAIIPNYFYEDTINLLYGQAGSYKTFWAIWEGVSLVLGKELCGLPIQDTKQHKVLYISLEMTAKDIAHRLAEMTNDLTQEEKNLVNENFIIISAEDTSLTAKTNNLLSALGDVCDSNGFDIVYIDALADYTAGFDLRSEGDMTAVINDLRQFVLKHHVSFRIIHHGTKPTQDTNGSMAGIHTIRDLCDYVFLIKADSEKEIMISSNQQKDKSAKSRYSEAITMQARFVSDNGSISFVKLDATETTTHIEKVKKLLTVIEENQGIGKSDLRDKMNRISEFDKIISDAIKAGSIIANPEKSEKGQKKICHYTADYYNEFVIGNKG